MLYGVFSDVHANYEAMKAVLAFYGKNKVQRFIFCGDLVGYGPQPQECVDALLSLKELFAVTGNHDAAVTARVELKWFSPAALAGIEFSGRNLSGKAMAFLASLPEKIETTDFTLVHGSPRKPLTEYILGEAQFTDNLNLWRVSPCFVGHTHMAAYFRQNGSGKIDTDFLPASRRFMAGEGAVILNPGSVGQPRDGDPRASCGIYDSESRSFEIFKVPYNIEETRRLITEKALPAQLGERLALGY